MEQANVKVKKAEAIESPWRMAFRRLRKNKLAMIGLGILLLMLLFCVIGPILSPYDTLDNNPLNKKLAPSAAHWLGTDQAGRDVLLRLMEGGRVSLLVGIVVVGVQVIIGIIIGGLAGFYGKWVDTILMRVTDIFLAVPFFPTLIVLGAIMSDLKIEPKRRIFIVMFIIGAMSWPSLARLIRGQILSLREQEFMQAAEALGIRDSKKIFRHLIPNVVPTIIVSATLGIGGAILTESALSFIGLGVAPPYASWGNMMQTARNAIDLAKRPWLWVPPGICIFVTVMAINLLGDGLRDALDPKMKR
ncbi:MAG: ABC transporter permease [Peptostreptococcaceae bacterium]|nr:ABC transporter permease [Peptostreptococcaceae bacterium]